MTKEALASFMRAIFEDEIMALRESGHKEYAGRQDNAFGNFERLAEELALDRKEVLWVYAMKHKDGIASYIRGHTSQREDVRGRINDLIVYLFILRGMVEDEESDFGPFDDDPEDSVLTWDEIASSEMSVEQLREVV